jgi:hypothetical protein
MWIKNNIVGRITKNDLDTERIRETNVLDMMQNTAILSHPESIIEMQIACLIFFFITNGRWESRESYNYGEGIKEIDESAIVNFGQSYHDFSLVLVFMMLTEHILTYIFSYIKKNDLFKRGEIGADGIETTALCNALDGLSFFLEFVISLLTILHLC